MPKSLVLFHANCADGFGAAIAAYTAIGEAGEYVAVQHGQPPPDVTGRDVYILDFSYPRDVLEQMFGVANSLLVLDHHESAQQALAGLTYARFDLTHSGAVLAWEYFHPGTRVPDLLAYVEDRDLWHHALPQTHEISAYLRAVGYEWPDARDEWPDARDE